MCGIALVAQRLRAGEDGRTGSGCDAPCDCERPRAHSCQSGCATCNQDTAQEPITSSPSHSQTASVLQPSLLQQSAAPHLVCACIGSPSIESLAASLHRRGPDRSSALSLQLPPLQVQVPCVIPVAAPPLELPFESTQKAPGFSPAFSPQVGLPEQHERNVGAAAAHSLPEQHLQDRSLQEQHSLLLEERKLRENLPLPVTRLSLLGAVLQAGEVTQPLMDQHGNVLLFNGEIFGGLPGLQPSENDSLALLSALSSCCPCYRPSPRSLRSTSPSLNPSTITATTKISDVSITTTVGNSSSSSSSTGNSNSRTSAGSCSSSTSTGRSSSSSATPIDPLAHSPALPSSPLSARPTPSAATPTPSPVSSPPSAAPLPWPTGRRQLACSGWPVTSWGGAVCCSMGRAMGVMAAVLAAVLAVAAVTAVAAVAAVAPVAAVAAVAPAAVVATTVTPPTTAATAAKAAAAAAAVATVAAAG
ncbi:hypothetical protein CLOM_g6057 [Closterium sp. NIES-68]|nr:hypothetical protein CLOM_g6057 [Closterium sp. NIES-68]